MRRRIHFSVCLPIVCVAVLAGSCGPGDRKRAAGDVPERVVVMSPAIAEMLEALELGDRVVGVGEAGPWPDTMADLPRVGRFDNPNAELLLELETDLLINIAGEAVTQAHERLKALDIEVLEADTSTFDGVLETVRRLGDRFDAAERARILVGEQVAALEVITARAADLPRRKVLVVVGRDPLYVAGPGSHFDQMVSRVGGRNAFSDVDRPYATVSMETVLQRLPDVIVDTTGRSGESPWSKWTFLPAVARGQVWHVRPEKLAVPGIELAEMTERMGRLIHPSLFGEPEPGDGAVRESAP